MRENQLLLFFLEQQRNHVLGILDGLTDEQLRRPVLPSGWSCLGLLRHLSLDDEHYWFRCMVVGESLDFFTNVSTDDGGAWHVAPDVSAEQVFQLYRDEIARSNAIIASTPPDAPPRQRDTWWPEGAYSTVETILVHVIAETACHAGHLDVAREILDGRQWIVLEE